MLSSLWRSPCAPRSPRAAATTFRPLWIALTRQRVRTPGRQRCATGPALEYLEDRCLLAPLSPASIFMHPGTLEFASAAGLPAGFTPALIRHAYGFDRIAFDNGAVKGDGSGQTIAIIDAYNQPDLANDLAAFDATFGIAAPPSFTKVNETGGSALPAASVSWGVEESLDVEWAHAIAPGARILLVEANSASYADLLTAINFARYQPGVSVVSMSFGGSEWSGETAYDTYFTTPPGHGGVTFVASTGDTGSSGGPESPSVSANVLAVGGTQLFTDASGNYLGESAWSGSGGGISAYEARPAYQNGVVTQTTTRRAVPDVAYDASGSSPFAVFDSYGYSGWLEVYGTSAGAPQWAGLIAIADQGRALAGKAALDGATQTLPAIYQLPSADFHDITNGSNGSYSAGPGYDLVTGRGSPVANLVVSGLIGGTSTLPAPTPPQFLTRAHASGNPVVGTTTVLSALGTDAAGSANLTYTWSLVSGPAAIAAPTFSANGTNAAQNTIASFHGAGGYTFLVTLKDAASLTATSSVNVTVNATQTYLVLRPGTVSLSDGKTQQFAVAAEDQFGRVLSKQPAWTWSIVFGAGTITNKGLYTAPSAGNGTSVVRASGGGQSIAATVNYTAPTPAIPSNVTAVPVSSGWMRVSWKNNSPNDTGFLIERSVNGGPWRLVGAVGANVTFFDDTMTVRSNNYAYRVAAYNKFGISAYSSATARIQPRFLTIGATAVEALSGLRKFAGLIATATAQAVGFPPSAISLAGLGQRIVNASVGNSRSQARRKTGDSSIASDAFWRAFGRQVNQDWFRTDLHGPPGPA